MTWFDFTDITFVAFFTTCVIVLGLLISFAIYIGTDSLKEKIYLNKISNETNTIRIYVINVKESTALYFNKSDIRHKKTIPLTDFYSFFHINDQEKIKNWIVSISLDPTHADQFLEADAIAERGKGTFFSLLKFIKFNPENGLIHLESHLLKFITPLNKNKKKKHGIPTGAVPRSTVETLIKSNKSGRGFTFAIRFFHVRQKVLSFDKIERYMITTLKNSIFPFANDKRVTRQIINDEENELFLIDLHLVTRDDAQRLASSIAHAIKKCIGVNGYEGTVSFSIGVIENFQFYHDFDFIIKKGQDACMIAQHNGEEILMFQKAAASMVVKDFREDIERLLKNPLLMRINYRPIVDVSRIQILGYFSYVQPYDSPFASYSDLIRHAATIDKNKELFVNIANRTIDKFFNERPQIMEREFLRLFQRVSLVDCDNMLEILPQISHTSDIHLVLVFDEQEINENSSEHEKLIEYLSNYHSYGYEIAMLMKDKNLLLDHEIYKNFDYFIVDAHMLSDIKKNQRTRLSIHSLVEQLLKYKRPIIATDLKDKQSIELTIKSGITLVSAQDICAANDMLLPVEKKKMDRLVEIHNPTYKPN